MVPERAASRNEDRPSPQNRAARGLADARGAAAVSFALASYGLDAEKATIGGLVMKSSQKGLSRSSGLNDRSTH